MVAPSASWWFKPRLAERLRSQDSGCVDVSLREPAKTVKIPARQVDGGAQIWFYHARRCNLAHDDNKLITGPVLKMGLTFLQYAAHRVMFETEPQKLISDYGTLNVTADRAIALLSINHAPKAWAWYGQVAAHGLARPSLQNAHESEVLNIGLMVRFLLEDVQAHPVFWGKFQAELAQLMDEKLNRFFAMIACGELTQADLFKPHKN